MIVSFTAQLMGHILRWEGLISSARLQEMAVDGLLNRYLLLALQHSHLYFDSLEKAKAVSTYLLLTSFSRSVLKVTDRVFSPLIYGARVINQREKRGSVTYSTDRENEVSKILIISLRLIGRAGKETFKFSGPYSGIQPAKLTNHTARFHISS